MILQVVSDHEYTGGCRYTGYIHKTIKLKLACGHEQYRKASQGVPRRARCRDCEKRPLVLRGSGEGVES